MSGLTRRQILKHAAAGVLIAPLGCSSRASQVPAGSAWATAGTTSLRSVTIPEPFAAGAGSRCELICSATIGPCYAKSVERSDISEGQRGLPTRLSFLVVDTACRPVANADVDVWHAAPKGVYSGDDAIEMCTANDAEALRARYFRGFQRTNAAGRVDFDTCFPGWYHGRTTHIHFTVRANGVELVTSQLGFDDHFVDGIVASEPIYRDRGPRDTTNATDSIVGAANVFETQRLPSGVLVASKVLVLRASSADALCAIEGRGGPPGGGPPPGFPPGPPPRR